MAVLPAAGQDVMLGWQASPDPSALGYNIYYGTTSHNYTSKISVGNVTNTTLSGLVGGITYYFAATTYDAINQESGFSNEALYTVPITATNQPPTLKAINDLTLNQNAGTQSVALTGISSGSPTEIQTLTITAVSANLNLIPTPIVTYTSPGTTGSLIFTPVANASGTSVISVTVNDGGTSNNIIVRTFTVTVIPNLAPTLDSLNNVVVNENSPVRTINLSGITSGSPGENQTLKITATSSKTDLIPNPTISYTSPNAAGSLSFQPVGNNNGSAIITVTVNDGGTSNNIVTRTFNVTVTPNLPPTLDSLNNVVVSENSLARTISLSGITSGSPGEIQTLKITATSSKTYLIPNPTITYTSPNAAGSLSFQPVGNTNGSAIITVTVNDGGTSNNIVTRTFNVTVTPNLPPTLDAVGNVIVSENVPLQTIALTGISSGSINEVQSLKVTVVCSKPSLIPTPTISYTTPNNSALLSFKPVSNTNGTATITVTVDDGGTQNNLITRTFTITVNPATNLPPTLNAIDNVTINENVPTQTIALTGISSGSINEAQTLKVTAASSKPSLIPAPTVVYASPNATGYLSFKPVNNMTGTATITVTVNDGGTKSNLVTKSFVVTVKYAPNQPPTLVPLNDLVINEDAATQTVLLTGISSGSINEAQPLKITVASSKTSLIPTPKITYTSPNATATLNFKPVISASGTAIISVTVNDGGTSNHIVIRTFAVTVNPNLPPTLNVINNVTVDENSPPYGMHLTGITSGSPAENQPLKITVTSSKPSLIPVPTLVYTSPNLKGILTFKPVNNASGTAVISVTVNDGGTRSNLVKKSFVVTVNHTTNLPPTLNALGNLVVNENVPMQTISLAGISSGSLNEDQPLKVTVSSSKTSLIPTPTIIYTSPNNAGLLSFKPINNMNGTATISVTVNDGGAISNLITRSFNVTVNHVNIPPTLDAISDMVFNQPPTLDPISDYVVNKNAGWATIPLKGISSGASAENQTLTVTTASNDTGLIPNPIVNYASSNSVGSLSFKPVANAIGTTVIRVTVKDNGNPNRLVTQTFMITVLGQTNNSGNLSISDLATPNTALAGQNLTFSVSALGKAPLHYQWKFNGGDITFATNAVLFLNQVDVSQSGDYSVMVFNHEGATNSDAATLAIFPAATPNLPPVVSTNFDPSALTQTIPLAGVTSGSSLETQALTVTAVSSNPTLIPNPTVNYLTPQSTGSLTYAPVRGTSGTAIISVTVNDGGASNNITTKSFNITINPVAKVTLAGMLGQAAPINPLPAMNLATEKLTSKNTEPASAVVRNVFSNTITTLNVVPDLGVSPPSTITLIPAGLVDGQFSINITGATNYKCVVQASTNLVDWIDVETNTVPFVFIDGDAVQYKYRYYRTVGK